MSLQLTRENSNERIMSHALAARCGVDDDVVSSSIRKNPGYTDFSIVEMARECLRLSGGKEQGFASEVIGRALTTSDLPAILGDSVNKILASAYQYSKGTYQLWVEDGEAKDFKQISIVRCTPPAGLPKINESGEYKFLSISDGEETVELETYGGILPLSRQALINDDIGAIKRPGKMLALTARMTKNRLVYQTLLNNPVLSDGKALFHADRNNVLSGAGSALSRDSLADAVKVCRMMADKEGTPLSVEPKYLLVPPSLEVTAFELCLSDSIPGQNNASVPNLFKKLGIVPIVEPLLESEAMTGGSSTGWYLMPDPAIWPVFQAFGLGSGSDQAPLIDSQPQFNKDTIEFKVRVDFTVGAVGTKAVKSVGA